MQKAIIRRMPWPTLLRSPGEYPAGSLARLVAWPDQPGKLVASLVRPGPAGGPVARPCTAGPGGLWGVVDDLHGNIPVLQ